MLSLQTLLGPTPLAEFLARYWEKKHLFERGPSPALEGLRSALRDFDVGAMVDQAGSADAMGYADGVTDRRNDLAPRDAMPLYAAGYTLYFNVHGFSPVCAELLSNLVRDVGIVPAGVYASVFASRTGSGLRPHLDQNENFTVQLHGTKRWVIWPTTVRDPLHAIRHGEPLVDPVSAMYADPAALSAPLGQGTEVVMEPGGFLYHPRGSWHATAAGDESVSLNLCITPLTWFQVMFGAMEARLTTEPALRRAISTRGDVASLARSLEEAGRAARRAAEHLDPMDAAAALKYADGTQGDLLTLASAYSGAISPATRVRRSTVAAFELVQSQDGGLVLRGHVYLGRLTRHLAVSLPSTHRAAALGLASLGAPSTLRRLASGEEDYPLLLDVARALLELGLLRT